MEYPEGVVDKKEYLKMVALSKKKIFNKGKVIETSDNGIVVLSTFVHIIRNKIRHLPKAEQTEILKAKEKYTSLNSRLSIHKRRAFGGKLGPDKENPGGHKGALKGRETQIKDMFIKFYSVEEVAKEAITIWGLPIGISSLKAFYLKHQKEIEQEREKFKASYLDVRLGIKRSRLEELTFLYSFQKDRFHERPSNETYRLLLTTLESIRKEAEGDRLTIDGKLDISYEVNIQQHLQAEVFRTMNLKEIILGRVAAKMKISPVKLIFSLNQSYYKKFSNVLGDFDEGEGGQVVYPSQLSYDFERIGRAQQQLDDDIEDAVILEDHTVATTRKPDQAEGLKERLQKALLQKIENLKNKKK